MRLLIVTRENAEDRRYGLGQAIGRIAMGLERKGHDVVYLCQTPCEAAHRRWQPRILPLLRPFGPLAPALTERLVQGACAARQALRMSASHVWVHDPWLMAGVRLGLWRQGRLGRPPFKVIISEHGLGSFAWAVTRDGLKMPSPLFRRMLGFERRVLSRADAVLCPSRQVLSGLLRDLGLTEVPTHVSVLGYGRPELSLPSRAQARQTLSLGAEVPVVLAVGRLTPVKRFEVVVDALARLEQMHGVAAQLVVAGGGDAERLLRLPQAQQLTHRPIIGLAEDMGVCLAAADAYVSACEVESFGLANREAVAAGLPCVVSSGGASGEVLGDGAWLMPAEPAGMAQALATLLSSPEMRAFWREQAHRASSGWPDWNEMIDDYEQRLLAL